MMGSLLSDISDLIWTGNVLVVFPEVICVNSLSNHPQKDAVVPINTLKEGVWPCGSTKERNLRLMRSGRLGIDLQGVGPPVRI
jgi:hypothetical protein